MRRECGGGGVKWAQNIVGGVALLGLGFWAATSLFVPFHVYAGPNVSVANRQGLACLLGDLLSMTPMQIGLARYGGDWLELPSVERLHGHVALDIPHWLINLIAWSMFYVLWRWARRHPKGHCQKCGYDLTGNERGTCSECGETSPRFGGSADPCEKDKCLSGPQGFEP